MTPALTRMREQVAAEIRRTLLLRDVSHILQVVLSAWFYVTPIIYPLDMLPAHYRWLLKLNPIIYVINGFRLAVYYGQLPKAPSIIASFVLRIHQPVHRLFAVPEVSEQLCLLRLSCKCLNL